MLGPQWLTLQLWGSVLLNRCPGKAFWGDCSSRWSSRRRESCHVVPLAGVSYGSIPQQVVVENIVHWDGLRGDLTCELQTWTLMDFWFQCFFTWHEFSIPSIMINVNYGTYSFASLWFTMYWSIFIMCVPSHDWTLWPRITTRMILLWFVATCRCVYVLAEQPGSSVMRWFPYVVYFMKVISKIIPWRLARLPGAYVCQFAVSLSTYSHLSTFPITVSMPSTQRNLIA